jgi:heptosyltransferase I
VHAMPAVMDVRAAFPQARIDWVVERGFAPLVRCCTAVDHAIECELRRWRKDWREPATRRAFKDFAALLRGTAYDVVLDLQGLTKSAVVARMARLASGGRRIALANRTDGSSYEAPTRWLASHAYRVEPHSHAVTRSRLLCAVGLGYPMPVAMRYGLQPPPTVRVGPPQRVALVHGTSRADKEWPESHWLGLGQRLLDAGYTIGLPHGNDAEEARSHRLAQAFGARAAVWPRMPLDQLLQQLSVCAGVVGVDSGLSHIAVALDLPHVQLYTTDTAWRTGPLPPADGQRARQLIVTGKPYPGLDAVWAAWQRVAPQAALRG